MRGPSEMAAPGAPFAADRAQRANALGFGVPGVLLLLAAVGWWWSARMASDMVGVPDGMQRHGVDGDDSRPIVGRLIVAWLGMMTAMMFPAISPVVKLYSRGAAAGRVAPLPVLRRRLHHGLDLAGDPRVLCVESTDGPDR